MPVLKQSPSQTTVVPFNNGRLPTFSPLIQSRWVNAIPQTFIQRVSPLKNINTGAKNKEAMIELGGSR